MRLRCVMAAAAAAAFELRVRARVGGVYGYVFGCCVCVCVRFGASHFGRPIDRSADCNLGRRSLARIRLLPAALTCAGLGAFVPAAAAAASRAA